MFVLLASHCKQLHSMENKSVSLGAVVSKGQADMLESISRDKVRDCEWSEELFLNSKVTGWASLTGHVRG